jgi:hypothetical protein
MADDAPEGWHVPQRPAMIAAVAAPLTLLAVVSGAGWLYTHTLKPVPRQPIALPAPGVESYIHDGARDPVRREAKPKRDARIEAAKRAVVAQGWSR